MTYICSECGKQVGRILDKDEKTLTFRCPHTRQQAVAMTQWGVA
jgi:DNA-directed RNA polymerase subunit RPC12/RpoP